MLSQIQKYSVYWYEERLASLLLHNDFGAFGPIQNRLRNFCTGPTGNNEKL